MPRRIRFLPGLALLPLAMAGCVHDQNMTVMPAASHLPVVTRSQHPIDLATAANGLAPGEAARLAGFLDGLDAGQGDRIATNATGAARDAIARVVGTHGLMLGAGDALPVADGGNVRVVVSRASARVSGCPDWSQAQEPTSGGAAGRNYGCASMANLAAMIADPEDLAHGRDNRDGADPRVITKAIKSWRDAKPTGAGGLKAESAGSGGGGGSSGGGQSGGTGQ